MGDFLENMYDYQLEKIRSDRQRQKERYRHHRRANQFEKEKQVRRGKDKNLINSLCNYEYEEIIHHEGIKEATEPNAIHYGLVQNDTLGRGDQLRLFKENFEEFDLPYTIHFDTNLHNRPFPVDQYFEWDYYKDAIEKALDLENGFAEFLKEGWREIKKKTQRTNRWFGYEYIISSYTDEKKYHHYQELRRHCKIYNKIETKPLRNLDKILIQKMWYYDDPDDFPLPFYKKHPFCEWVY